MSKRHLVSLVCALLLLVTQHAALTHSVWHIQGGHGAAAGPAAVSHHSQDDGSPQSKLCDLHFALGSLFSAGCAAGLVFAAPPPFVTPSAPPAAWRAPHALTTPPSRAPPVLL